MYQCLHSPWQLMCPWIFSFFCVSPSCNVLLGILLGHFFLLFCCSRFLSPWALLWALPISLGSLFVFLKYKHQSSASTPAPLFFFCGTGSFPGGTSCFFMGKGEDMECHNGFFSSSPISVFEPSGGLFVGVGVWISPPFCNLFKQIFLSFNNSTDFVHQESLHLILKKIF